ncbi:MAG: Pr6Pr family membrane protein [Nocardioidaceae bacterium]
MPTRRERPQLARVWHTLTLVNCGAAIVIQLVLVIRGINVLVEPDGTSASAAERVLRFFSYFTIQSNVLALVTAAALVARPDHDGRAWRLLRFAAVLGMTTTFIVYYVALRPILDLEGLPRVTDAMFHYLGPVLVLSGWLLFGPPGRVTRSIALSVLVWPIVYLIYTQLLGAATGWYPYPFLDADEHSLSGVLLNALLITLLVLCLAAVLLAADRELGRRSPVRSIGGSRSS